MSAKPAIQPKKLKPGSKVALVAPAFSFEKEPFEKGREFLEKNYRLRPSQLEHLFSQHHYLAGNDERRLGEFLHWLEDPGCEALFSVRGGYGCARIMPELVRFFKKKKNRLAPKIIVGFSDVTLILNAIVKELGWTAFHGPVTSGRAFFEPQPLEQKTFTTSLFSNKTLGKITSPSMKMFSPGKAKAPLVGGCLSLLVASLGTNYEVETDGKILFLEDVDEKPYRLDRMLTQLIDAGKLRKVKGLVLGAFEHCAPSSRDPSKTTSDQAVELALRKIAVDQKIPILTQFPGGHGRPQLTFPLGVEVTLNNLSLQFNGAGCR